MSKPKITEEEKKKLRDSAKAELERLEAIYSDEEVTKLLDDFKGKYNLCESVYKVVLVRYQKTKGRKPEKHLVVDGRQVEATLKFAGYNFDKALLTEIFGAKSTTFFFAVQERFLQKVLYFVRECGTIFLIYKIHRTFKKL